VPAGDVRVRVWRPRLHRDDVPRVRARSRREAQVCAVGARPLGAGCCGRAETTGLGDPTGDAMTDDGGTGRDGMRFETRAIHVGQEPDAEFGAVNVPIYQTSTYAQPAVGKPKAYDYARGGHPTREALQQALASLEGGKRAISFSSGLGASTTFLLTLKPGDHVIIGDDVYGGTYRLFSQVMAGWGLVFDTVD